MEQNKENGLTEIIYITWEGDPVIRKSLRESTPIVHVKATPIGNPQYLETKAIKLTGDRPNETLKERQDRVLENIEKAKTLSRSLEHQLEYNCPPKANAYAADDNTVIKDLSMKRLMAVQYYKIKR